MWMEFALSLAQRRDVVTNGDMIFPMTLYENKLFCSYGKQCHEMSHVTKPALFCK